MTTAEIIQLFKDTLRGDFMSDQDQELAADSVIVAELNKAQRRLAEWCGYRLSHLSVSIGPSYEYSLATLSATNRIRKIETVTLASNGQQWKPEPIDELWRKHPKWVTDTAAGNPYGVFVGGGKIVFYPAPASAVTFYLSGEVDPVELSSASTGASPVLDITLHEWIAKLAAAHVAKTNAVTSAQLSMIANVEREAKRQCLTVFYKEGTWA